MDTELATPLLAGLSPRQFMKRYWQRRPLLVRQAWPGVEAPVSRAELFALAARDDVESRLVTQRTDQAVPWQLRSGPFERRRLPPLARPRWTLLVQGVDLHVQAARDMLSRFRFIPDARVDDLMVSFATDGGGVGPHVDAYDVFLIQVSGRRRWRIGPVADPRIVPGLPVRILQNFEPDQDWVLEPGDMLYLPPRWGHDGIGVGEGCMTCSVGFRVPSTDSLAAELLTRMADAEGDDDQRLYRDPSQPATATPARIPEGLTAFARTALQRRLSEPGGLETALGEILSEPKAQVWFEPGLPVPPGAGVALDRRTRMLYDEQRIFINGESFRAAGRDARLMATLADQRWLDARSLARLSEGARECLAEWAAQGWLHAHSG